jgi:hypothetical protein
MMRAAPATDGGDMSSVEVSSENVPGPASDRGSYNSFATFEDQDGNGWLLQEITTRLPGR